MWSVAVTTVLAGLLALYLYQRMSHPFFWADLMYYLKLWSYRHTLQTRMQKGIITFLDCFLHQARTKPNKPFIIFEEQTLTYQDVDRRSNQFANAFRAEASLKKGDIVAQLMCNEPDFLCVWLGLCKLGCEVAFVNVNIKGKSLLHSLHSCGAKTLVVGAGIALLCFYVCCVIMLTTLSVLLTVICETFLRSKLFLTAQPILAYMVLRLAMYTRVNTHSSYVMIMESFILTAASHIYYLVHFVEEVLPDLRKDNVATWVVDYTSPSEDFNSLLDKVERMSGETLSELPKVDIMSNFLFIFTSGTTGLSKAARIGHLKAIMSMAFLQMCGATSDDIIYSPLPLYHMSASLLGIGGCIQLGATCVLKKKFSASQFWKDCVKHNVSVVQYIGELCRYLVNHPVVPEEKTHSVWLAAGSGLKSDVWKAFVKRFGGIRVREGYGLTEASIGFLNYTDVVGPIGRASFFNKLSMPFELLRYDLETYEPVRTDSGRCIRAQKGEPGILVAPMTAVNQFLGYAGNKCESEKKLLKNVFKTGDIYFNTGDLLVHDHKDFLYFHDRIGDTFRWKGENVSTTEVSEVLGLLDFIQETSVYGVTIPGYEGRAGMAAIVLKQDYKLNGEELYNHLLKTLPAYAWPWFLRIRSIPISDSQT
ncbi:Very long-chain acyl-CoA synthetase [Channa argus]|uniref:long-chain-fatty-acid--CoA ligase n=1 Tax=Channa argus TaxID=215402 RepID=A0A6G1QJ73_CHAAH|nr:Very long-chain acyl-CoA synthetase [Channa argus]